MLLQLAALYLNLADPPQCTPKTCILLVVSHKAAAAQLQRVIRSSTVGSIRSTHVAASRFVGGFTTGRRKQSPRAPMSRTKLVKKWPKSNMLAINPATHRGKPAHPSHHEGQQQAFTNSRVLPHLRCKHILQGPMRKIHQWRTPRDKSLCSM